MKCKIIFERGASLKHIIFSPRESGICKLYSLYLFRTRVSIISFLRYVLFKRLCNILRIIFLTKNKARKTCERKSWKYYYDKSDRFWNYI